MTKNESSVIPKFFCENCGKEVKKNTKLCPYCGRFFSSVRCPNCNYIGNTDEFTVGCPSCGYAVNSNSKNNQKTTKGYDRPRKIDRANDALPWWIYSLVAGLLIFLIVYILLYP